MWQLFYELEGTVERVAARAQRGVDDTVRGAIAVGERGVVFVGREYSLTTARFDCVYTACEDALPRAWTELAKRFSDIELDQVLHNLFDALGKMVVAILGSMTTGAAIGGAAGAFAGGVGAVPGAVGGAAVGLDVAMDALYVMGLAEVADYVVHALPEALRLYGRGLQEAWNAPQDPLSGAQRPDYARRHHVSVATGLIADAHERMVVLILMGLVACLLAKLGTEALAKTLGEGTLGEDFADWFTRNAPKIKARPDLQPRNWMPRTAPAEGYNDGLGTAGAKDGEYTDLGTSGSEGPITIQTRPSETVNAEMAATGQQPAWLPDTNVVTETVPAGTRYNMVVNEGQAQALMRGEPAFGGWATTDSIPNQAYARNELAIAPEFKPDVGYVATVETIAPQTLNSGFVGPLGGGSGGGTQVQFLGQRNLSVIGIKPLPTE